MVKDRENKHLGHDDDDDDPLVSMLHSCSHNNGRYDGLRENTLVLFVQLFAIIFLSSALYWGLSEEKRHRGRVFCRKPPYDWLGKTKSIKSANIPQMIDYRFEFFLLRKKSVCGNHFSFACISSYSLILWYLLFERVLMFETNWHLFGQNKIVFTRKSVFGRKLC